MNVRAFLIVIVVGLIVVENVDCLDQNPDYEFIGEWVSDGGHPRKRSPMTYLDMGTDNNEEFRPKVKFSPRIGR